jgi:hypothetical protein
MWMREANFLVVCAVAAFGLAASLAFAFATGGSAQASVDAAGAQFEPLQIMMNSNDLPAAHYDDYSVVFN